MDAIAILTGKSNKAVKLIIDGMATDDDASSVQQACLLYDQCDSDCTNIFLRAAIAHGNLPVFSHILQKAVTATAVEKVAKVTLSCFETAHRSKRQCPDASLSAPATMPEYIRSKQFIADLLADKVEAKVRKSDAESYGKVVFYLEPAMYPVHELKGFHADVTRRVRKLIKRGKLTSEDEPKPFIGVAKLNGMGRNRACIVFPEQALGRHSFHVEEMGEGNTSPGIGVTYRMFRMKGACVPQNKKCKCAVVYESD